MIRVLAHRRFNFVDGFYLGMVGAQFALGHFWSAVGWFVVGVVASVIVEAIDAAALAKAQGVQS